MDERDAHGDEAARDAAFRALPPVGTVAARARAGGSRLSDAALAAAAADALAEARDRVAGGDASPRPAIVERAAGRVLALERARLAPVLNATGVVIHTNLGRAPVSAETAAAMAAASGAVALELDPETNERGGRMDETARLMRLLCGAEATLVVNNCAAATLLVLSAVAAGRKVVVSRGEAVEIGGGFRVPDVLRQSGAVLAEVGTTNRTYARDYLAATDEQTAAYLKVHASNFRMVGFTHAATVGELAAVARERGVALLDDLGSGALLDTAAFGLGSEPTFAGSLGQGADLVMASGDKLVGGPQAGIIVGRASWVERVARHPLARAVRADKTCLAGLAATLRHYARGEATETVPVWRMIAAPEAALRARAEELAAALRERSVAAESVASVATVGGGSLPGESLPSRAVAIDAAGPGVDELARRLRTGEPGVFGRIERGRLLLDLRTVLPEDDERLREAVVAGVARGR